MKQKRKVSKNLGRTQHQNAEVYYDAYKRKYGPTKVCPFYGGKKYAWLGPDLHDKLNPQHPNPAVPIEEFDFMKAGDGSWKLQAYCKICYKAYRDARIKNARKNWVFKNGRVMTDDHIRQWYRQNVGQTMQCSVCKRDLPPEKFRISKSMEKGLHNVCYECESSSGTSVREQAWLSEGDWSSWKKTVQKMRRQKKVECAGWSRSVASDSCLLYDKGKLMHADHIVPLRAGGLHDKKNFQPLCSQCNEKKSDQIDPNMTPQQIRLLVGEYFVPLVKNSDTVTIIERKLKSGLVKKIGDLIRSKKYLQKIKEKKKEVNGQWGVYRTEKKGVEWYTRMAVNTKKPGRKGFKSDNLF